MKRLSLPLALIALVLLAWLLWPKAPPPAASSPPTSQLSSPNSQLPSAPSAPPVSRLSTLNSQLSSSVPFPLNSPSTDIAADLHLLADTFETFRTNFPRDGNPVGENAEITAALLGQNQLHLALIPPGHPAINVRGELCDRWGTPFFFHQLSGSQTEIRSAGPDRLFHTADDALLTP